MSVERTPNPLTPLQHAFLLLKQTQAKLRDVEQKQAEPIAIIGMACRFPGTAKNPRAFWELLCQGQDAVTEVPTDRWDVDEYYDPDPAAPGKMNTRWGGFIEDVGDFDAEFFGISPREAVRVDPQQRLLLEVSWEALEDAGIPSSRLAQSQTGVYVGVVGSDYAFLQSKDSTDFDVFSGTGCSHSILANRVSYALNLNGPSLTLDTACSSSLVTVHLACQSLRRGESNLALAGGVNLLLSPEMTIVLTKGYMMSADGHCKTFDAAADGYVRGEGCGMVVLKRLRDAVRDGDRIAAVIRGSAINHDGRSNGLSAPSGPAQESVIRACLADAGLSPTDIHYIEAHGTGTRLGDPIEIEALRSALCQGRSPDRPLVVSSVKTNIGHLESAAGIAGLIKVVLMLRHNQIPAHLNLKSINPLLRIEDTPIEIPTTIRDWPRSEGPRRAGVSAFGFGGTNAHIILEDPPARKLKTEGIERPRHLVCLSARSPQALSAQAKRYVEHLNSDCGDSLADIAFSSTAGREHFNHRAAMIVSSLPELQKKLQSLALDADSTEVDRNHLQTDRAPKVAFLFTGQGSQYAGMGRLLYETQPTFRAVIDRCAEILEPYLDRPLVSLFATDTNGHVDQTGYTQPVLFAFEYALATLWRSWGVEPAAVIGHSVGEFAAACIAGVFSLEDGLTLIAKRAALMQSLPPGGLMLAVFASEEYVDAALKPYEGKIAIAARNGPKNIVVSGDESAVRRLMEDLAAGGIKAKPLTTSHAFHSHRMDSILDPLDAAAAAVTYSAPRIPIISNLTGQVADKTVFSAPDYYSRHARSAVRFAESIKTLADRGCNIFLEIGPNPVLVGMGRTCVPDEALTWLASMRSGRDDWKSVLESLAKLYLCGTAIDWNGFDRDYQSQQVDWPTYAFQRKRYWVNAGAGNESASRLIGGPVLHPLLGRRVITASDDQIFEAELAANRPAILADHQLQGVVVMPGAGYLEMILAASAVTHGMPWNVCNVRMVEPLLFDKGSKTIQTVISPDGPSAASFRIVCVTRSDPQADPVFLTLVSGRLEAPREAGLKPVDTESERTSYTNAPRDGQWILESLQRAGLQPGPTFLWAKRFWYTHTTGLAELRSPQASDHLEEYQIHPGLLDTCFQILGGLLPGAGDAAFVPMGIGRIRFYQSPREAAWISCSIKDFNGQMALADIQLLDRAGEVLVVLEEVRLQIVPRDWLARKVAGPLPEWCFHLDWASKPVDVADVADNANHGEQWLIFNTSNDLGNDLAMRLELKGHQTTLIPADADADRRQTAIQDFHSKSTPGRSGIVYLSAVDIDAQGGAPDFAAAHSRGWGGVLDIVHGLAGLNALPNQGSHDSGSELPHLWLVTCGAETIPNHPQRVRLAQSPMWGQGRVIAAELPGLACVRIDLDPDNQTHAADQLAEELCFGKGEDQVVYREGVRYVARLRRWKSSSADWLKVPEGQPYRLEITKRGQLDNVVMRPTTRDWPGPGQVEIRVKATGLNFRDVLNVLDLYPGDPGPLGGECSGEVVAVGPGVDHVKIGDSVVALAAASFASYVITPAQFVGLKPEHLSFEEAATIPICFMTVHLALHRLGKVGVGERVLIHAATGGVGMAAIQMARHAGAEIFATAGSEQKREFLRSLGIVHVMDSRSLDFQQQIMQATQNEGVDLVINSLTGEAIGAGLSVLRTGGRFLELGKNDLWDQARVDTFKPGLTFFPIALDYLMADDPETVRQLLAEVLPQFENQKLSPLPLRAFPIPRIVDALRHMARTEHIGKVVIQSATPEESIKTGFHCHEDGAYLVTGGLGGLGLKVARWLIDRGAKFLVLVGRSAASVEARRQLEEFEKGGVRLLVEQCDIGNRVETSRLLSRIRSELAPLHGIYHLAGVLDDGILNEQSRERFDHVMDAKAIGAWNLHDLTRDDPLEQFVMFSSAASLLGSPGQGNYAAANAFLDALAHERRFEKRPALSINWGAWAEVGMAARLSDSDVRRLAASGLGVIEPVRGLRILEHLLNEKCTQSGVLPIEWPKFFERIPAGSEPAWLSEMADAVRSVSSPEQSRPLLLEKLQAVTPSERLELAITSVRKLAAKVMAMDQDNLPDPRRTLNELGFDSLTAVEFVNRVGQSIGQQISPSLLFDYPTLESLSQYVVRDLLQLDTATSSSSEADVTELDFLENAATDVEEMSEEEMDAEVTRQIELLSI